MRFYEINPLIFQNHSAHWLDGDLVVAVLVSLDFLHYGRSNCLALLFHVVGVDSDFLTAKLREGEGGGDWLVGGIETSHIPFVATLAGKDDLFCRVALNEPCLVPSGWDSLQNVKLELW